ncbi:hypothetical protein [Sulfuricurvum kujiense]|uniref:hypothetical protein n=1 Tax=Sulfuricurvum kujiense TaxID=148813 RepID=UPI0002FFC8B7|nr:hypothetical protein [Sulfuricurvum kujiense]
MKWLVITVGFFLPALVLLFNAHTLKEQIEALGGLILGSLLIYITLYPNDPRVKRWLERF